MADGKLTSRASGFADSSEVRGAAAFWPIAVGRISSDLGRWRAKSAQ